MLVVLFDEKQFLMSIVSHMKKQSGKEKFYSVTFYVKKM